MPRGIFGIISEIFMKEVTLSKIRLKYFSNKPNNAGGIKYPKPCFVCRRKIIRMGGSMSDKKGNEQFICEDCAIVNFQIQEGFKTKRAAAARRRRIFDVNYLLQEMVADLYMEKHGLRSIDSLPNSIFENIISQSATIYNAFFDVKEKKRIEELVTQKEIERELKKALPYFAL